MTTRMRWITLFAALLPWATPAAALDAPAVTASARLAPQGDAKLTVKAAIAPATAKPGDTVTLTLTATVAAGFHAYGTLEPTNIPVSLDSKKLQLSGLMAKGPAVVPPGDKHVVLGAESFPLPNTFQVTQQLTVPADAKAAAITVRGELEYQVCDENMCLPPDTASFAAKVSIEVAQDNGKLKVTASFEPATAKPGDTVTLVLSATVEDGWHAYGSKEKTNIPVAFDPKKQQFAGLLPAGGALIPPGDKHQAFGMDSYPLPSSFRVTQALKLPADAKPGELAVRGELDYQVCDANSCEPPDAAGYAATLKVEAGTSQKQKEQQPEAVPAPLPGIGGDGRLTLRSRFEPAIARAGEKVTLVLTAEVEPGYHAYGSKETGNTPVTLDTGMLELGALQLAGEVEIPPGESHAGLGGPEFQLPPEFEVKVPLAVPAAAPVGEAAVRGELAYGVCDENHCEPATTAPFAAKLMIEAGAARMSSPPPSPAGSTEAGAAAPGIPAQSLWLLVLLSIGGGLFALAMPCTYPMIPITFSFFTKQAEKRGGKVLPLALAYGFGIVIMFTLVGALMSAVIVDVVNHWITNSIIGAVFLLFSFVLFGWINLQPPAFLQQVAGKASHAGGYLGVFFMGATLVVSSFTCTAPIVGSLLANVAQYGVPRVAFGMAIFGTTMAAPFVVLSLMPTRVKQMPRSGEWMETLKVSLGFLELAAALKFVSMVDFALAWGVLPRELFLMLWAAIFVLWAGYLFGILRKKDHPNEGVGNGRMAAGMLVFLLAAYFLFGALGFKLDFVMTNFVPGYSAELVVGKASGSADGKADGHVGRHTIVLDDNPKAVALATKQDKLLLYNFTGFN